MGRLSFAFACACALVLGWGAARADAQDRTPTRIFFNDWSQGRVRPFLAWSASAGSVARGDVTIGYGKPYWTWIGVESGGMSTRDMAMTHLRARLALVVADLAIGWGRVWAYKHTTLPRQARYEALSVPGREDAAYRTLQLWLFGLLPAPGGYIDWQLEGLRIYGVDDDSAVYEEALRAVVFPGWALVGRLGYAFQFASKRGSVGALAEVLWPGDRGDYIARVGPMLGWAFSPSFDVGLTLTMTVHSPDALDVYEDLWGSIRVRYRGATGR